MENSIEVEALIRRVLNSNLIFYSSVFVSHFSHMNNRVHKPKRAYLIRYFIRCLFHLKPSKEGQ